MGNYSSEEVLSYVDTDTIPLIEIKNITTSIDAIEGYITPTDVELDTIVVRVTETETSSVVATESIDSDYRTDDTGLIPVFISGLVPNTKYTLTSFGNFSEVFGEPSETVATTDSITNVKLDKISSTHDSITIEFSTVNFTDADSVVLNIAGDGFAETFDVDWDESMNLTIFDLSPNTDYSISAYAMKNGFNGSITSAVATTDVQNGVIALNAEAVFITISASATVNPNISVDSYVIDVNAPETSGPDPIEFFPDDLINGKLEVTFSTGVLPLTTYNVSVHSVKDGEESRRITQTITTGLPDSPDITTSGDFSSVTVDIGKVPGDVESYSVAIAPADDPTNIIESIIVPAENVTDPILFDEGILPNNTYVVTSTAQMGNYSSEEVLSYVDTDTIPLIEINNITTSIDAIEGYITPTNVELDTIVVRVTETETSSVVATESIDSDYRTDDTGLIPVFISGLVPNTKYTLTSFGNFSEVFGEPSETVATTDFLNGVIELDALPSYVSIIATVDINPKITADSYEVSVYHANESVLKLPIVQVIPAASVNDFINITFTDGLRSNETYIVSATTVLDGKSSTPVQQSVTTGFVEPIFELSTEADFVTVVVSAYPIHSLIDNYVFTITQADMTLNILDTKTLPGSSVTLNFEFENGLLPNTSYVVKGYTTLGNSTSAPVESEVQTEELPIITINNYTVTATTFNAQVPATLLPISAYVFEVRDLSGNTSIKQLEVSWVSGNESIVVDFKNLSPKNDYVLTSYSTLNGIHGILSSVEFTTADLAPLGLTATEVFDTAVLLQWNHLEEVDSYEITIKNNDNTTDVIQSRTINNGSFMEITNGEDIIAYNVTSLKPGYLYVFKVTPIVNEIKATTANTSARTVIQPVTLSLFDTTERNVTIIFNPANGYKEYYMLSVENQKEVVSEGFENVPTSFYDLLPGKEYSATIVTHAGDQSSTPYVSDFRMKPAKVQSPAFSSTLNTITTTFDPAEGVKDFYEVNLLNIEEPTEILDMVIVPAGNETFGATFRNLTAGTKYQVSFITVSGGLSSIPRIHQTRTGMIPHPPPPPIPPILPTGILITVKPSEAPTTTAMLPEVTSVTSTENVASENATTTETTLPVSTTTVAIAGTSGTTIIHNVTEYSTTTEGLEITGTTVFESSGDVDTTTIVVTPVITTMTTPVDTTTEEISGSGDFSTTGYTTNYVRTTQGITVPSTSVETTTEGDIEGSGDLSTKGEEFSTTGYTTGYVETTPMTTTSVETTTGGDIEGSGAISTTVDLSTTGYTTGYVGTAPLTTASVATTTAEDIEGSGVLSTTRDFSTTDFTTDYVETTPITTTSVETTTGDDIRGSGAISTTVDFSRTGYTTGYVGTAPLTTAFVATTTAEDIEGSGVLSTTGDFSTTWHTTGYVGTMPLTTASVETTTEEDIEGSGVLSTTGDFSTTSYTTGYVEVATTPVTTTSVETTTAEDLGGSGVLSTTEDYSTIWYTTGNVGTTPLATTSVETTTSKETEGSGVYSTIPVTTVPVEITTAKDIEGSGVISTTADFSTTGHTTGYIGTAPVITTPSPPIEIKTTENSLGSEKSSTTREFSTTGYTTDYVKAQVTTTALNPIDTTTAGEISGSGETPTSGYGTTANETFDSYASTTDGTDLSNVSTTVYQTTTHSTYVDGTTTSYTTTVLVLANETTLPPPPPPTIPPILPNLTVISTTVPEYAPTTGYDRVTGTSTTYSDGLTTAYSSTTSITETSGYSSTSFDTTTVSGDDNMTTYSSSAVYLATRYSTTQSTNITELLPTKFETATFSTPKTTDGTSNVTTGATSIVISTTAASNKTALPPLPPLPPPPPMLPKLTIIQNATENTTAENVTTAPVTTAPVTTAEIVTRVEIVTTTPVSTEPVTTAEIVTRAEIVTTLPVTTEPTANNITTTAPVSSIPDHAKLYGILVFDLSGTSVERLYNLAGKNQTEKELFKETITPFVENVIGNTSEASNVVVEDVWLTPDKINHVSVVLSFNTTIPHPFVANMTSDLQSVIENVKVTSLPPAVAELSQIMDQQPEPPIYIETASVFVDITPPDIYQSVHNENEYWPGQIDLLDTLREDLQLSEFVPFLTLSYMEPAADLPLSKVILHLNIGTQITNDTLLNIALTNALTNTTNKYKQAEINVMRKFNATVVVGQRINDSKVEDALSTFINDAHTFIKNISETENNENLVIELEISTNTSRNQFDYEKILNENEYVISANIIPHNPVKELYIPGFVELTGLTVPLINEMYNLKSNSSAYANATNALQGILDNLLLANLSLGLAQVQYMEPNETIPDGVKFHFILQTTEKNPDNIRLPDIENKISDLVQTTQFENNNELGKQRIFWGEGNAVNATEDDIFNDLRILLDSLDDVYTVSVTIDTVSGNSTEPSNKYFKFDLVTDYFDNNTPKSLQTKINKKDLDLSIDENLMKVYAGTLPREPTKWQGYAVITDMIPIKLLNLVHGNSPEFSADIESEVLSVFNDTYNRGQWFDSVKVDYFSAYDYDNALVHFTLIQSATDQKTKEEMEDLLNNAPSTLTFNYTLGEPRTFRGCIHVDNKTTEEIEQLKEIRKLIGDQGTLNIDHTTAHSDGTLEICFIVVDPIDGPGNFTEPPHRPGDPDPPVAPTYTGYLEFTNVPFENVTESWISMESPAAQALTEKLYTILDALPTINGEPHYIEPVSFTNCRLHFVATNNGTKGIEALTLKIRIANQTQFVDGDFHDIVIGKERSFAGQVDFISPTESAADAIDRIQEAMGDKFIVSEFEIPPDVAYWATEIQEITDAYDDEEGSGFLGSGDYGSGEVVLSRTRRQTTVSPLQFKITGPENVATMPKHLQRNIRRKRVVNLKTEDALIYVIPPPVPLGAALHPVTVILELNNNTNYDQDKDDIMDFIVQLVREYLADDYDVKISPADITKYDIDDNDMKQNKTKVEMSLFYVPTSDDDIRNDPKVLQDDLREKMKQIPNWIDGEIDPDKVFVGAFDPCMDDFRENCSVNALCFGNVTYQSFECECKIGFEDQSPMLPEHPGRMCVWKEPTEDILIVHILIILASLMLLVILALIYAVYQKTQMQGTYSPKDQEANQNNQV